MDSGSWRWDLVGLPWAEAEAILAGRGLPFRRTVTAPPNRPLGVGELRVVAQRETPDGLSLVLAYREYQRPSPPGEGPGIQEHPSVQGGSGGAC